ncbi:uncharacterized protein [Ptychodera flava]|uniref:uncharacterized protein n=1 Tax=Ptychodera flava TaxID=63121 RepID=UPI00396A103D
MIKLLVAVVTAVICSTRVDAAPRACTWADIDYCEEIVTSYIRDPCNWNSQKKSALYCGFIMERVECLRNLNCDIRRSTEEIPFNINTWINIMESRLPFMIDYDLCYEKSTNPLEVNYEDECDEYYVNKQCMEELAEYLMSPYSLGCVAMLMANPCFSSRRTKCGIPQAVIDGVDLTPGNFVNPNIVIAETGHCRLFY